MKYVVTDSEEVPRGVKSMERESRGWLPWAEGGEHGEFQFGKMRRFWRWMVGMVEQHECP